LSDSTEGNVPVIGDADELRERAAEFLRAYRHGTDDAPFFVARDIARLPSPYAVALTAAICQELDEYELPRFARLLFTVAKGEYRSVFDRAED
jgi:hypothetical protein